MNPSYHVARRDGTVAESTLYHCKRNCTLPLEKKGYRGESQESRVKTVAPPR